ncbi:MAG: AAA family ATPase [Bacteroidota bacterium]
MKLLIFGASGAGTTTLASALAKNGEFVHLDADDYYWKPTLQPFTEKVPLAERNERLKADFYLHDQVVLSGSLVSWGQEWEGAFDLAIFIRLDNSIRMERLRQREKARLGDKLHTDPKVQQHSQAFLDWASQYEDPAFTGRSLRVHEDWISRLHCNVVRIDGALELPLKLKQVREGLAGNPL